MGFSPLPTCLPWPCPGVQVSQSCHCRSAGPEGRGHRDPVTAGRVPIPDGGSGINFGQGQQQVQWPAARASQESHDVACCLPWPRPPSLPRSPRLSEGLRLPAPGHRPQTALPEVLPQQQRPRRKNWGGLPPPSTPARYGDGALRPAVGRTALPGTSGRLCRTGTWSLALELGGASGHG